MVNSDSIRVETAAEATLFGYFRLLSWFLIPLLVEQLSRPIYGKNNEPQTVILTLNPFIFLCGTFPLRQFLPA